MRPAQMDVRIGNQRRKKAAAAMLAQMQAGGATAGLGGVRQTGGLARAGAKAGMIRGQGRGIPAGLEALYARAGDFARGNLGGYQLNAEQQPSGLDPAEAAQGYAIGNAINQDGVITDPGGQGGQSAGVGEPVNIGAPNPENPQPGAVNVGTPTAPVYSDVGGSTSNINNPARVTPSGSTFEGALPSYGAPKIPAGGFQDGQPMNGGIYYQGTIIPMGVWRAIQRDL